MKKEEQQYPKFRKGDLVQRDTVHGIQRGRIASVWFEQLRSEFSYTVVWANDVVEPVSGADMEHENEFMKTIEFRINGFIDELMSLESRGFPQDVHDLGIVLKHVMRVERFGDDYRKAVAELKSLCDLRNDFLGL